MPHMHVIYQIGGFLGCRIQFLTLEIRICYLFWEIQDGRQNGHCEHEKSILRQLNMLHRYTIYQNRGFLWSRIQFWGLEMSTNDIYSMEDPISDLGVMVLGQKGRLWCPWAMVWSLQHSVVSMEGQIRGLKWTDQDWEEYLQIFET